VDWGVLDDGAHWPKLVNAVELSMCSGVRLCQISLATCIAMVGTIGPSAVTVATTEYGQCS